MELELTEVSIRVNLSPVAGTYGLRVFFVINRYADKDFFHKNKTEKFQNCTERFYLYINSFDVFDN